MLPVTAFISRPSPALTVLLLVIALAAVKDTSASALTAPLLMILPSLASISRSVPALTASLLVISLPACRSMSLPAVMASRLLILPSAVIPTASAAFSTPVVVRSLLPLKSIPPAVTFTPPLIVRSPSAAILLMLTLPALTLSPFSCAVKPPAALLTNSIPPLMLLFCPMLWAEKLLISLFWLSSFCPPPVTAVSDVDLMPSAAAFWLILPSACSSRLPAAPLIVTPP